MYSLGCKRKIGVIFSKMRKRLPTKKKLLNRINTPHGCDKIFDQQRIFIDNLCYSFLDKSIFAHPLHTDFGFTNSVLHWLSSYLTNRTQYVSLPNHCSAISHVHSGVPHGLVLGPIRFSMHIMHLPAIIDSHTIHLQMTYNYIRLLLLAKYPSYIILRSHV